MIQGLVLFTFYTQIVGRGQMMAQLVAPLVRAAQQLGLHRDPRYLNLVAGHAEMRRRIWWSVFALDKYG